MPGILVTAPPVPQNTDPSMCWASLIDEDWATFRVLLKASAEKFLTATSVVCQSPMAAFVKSLNAGPKWRSSIRNSSKLLTLKNCCQSSYDVSTMVLRYHAQKQLHQCWGGIQVESEDIIGTLHAIDHYKVLHQGRFHMRSTVDWHFGTWGGLNQW
jgi:hypothetical protein